MTAKELINIINDYDVKVVFDKPEEVAQKIMNGIVSPIFLLLSRELKKKKMKKAIKDRVIKVFEGLPF